MGMALILKIAALVAFVLVAASAFLSGVSVNEMGFLAAGLALWVGSDLDVD